MIPSDNWKSILAQGLTNYTGFHCQNIELEVMDIRFNDFSYPKMYPYFALIKKNGKLSYHGRAIGVAYEKTEYALFVFRKEYGLLKEKGYPAYNYYNTWDDESIIKIEGRLTKDSYRQIKEAMRNYNPSEVQIYEE
ncbi:MAG: hypothetical protein HPY53_01415 [Brevinematales bacterium]|nr:hypothetical protein [Brevinematales bacterium]